MGLGAGEGRPSEFLPGTECRSCKTDGGWWQSGVSGVDTADPVPLTTGRMANFILCVVYHNF